MAGGGAGGMGQPIGNASALPQGNPFGGGMGGGFGGGSPFGMQQPSYGMQNPYINSMPGPSSAGGYMGQQTAMSGSPPYGMYQSRQQPPEPNQVAQPMPQQPQQPAYQSNPDYQAYQTQMTDLNRQMDEYVKKAPMYQQIQDLQGKMRGFQQPQGQMGDTGFNNRMGMLPPGMGGYGGRMGGYDGGYGQQMPQQSMGLQGLYSMLQGRRGGFGRQQAAPPMMDEFY